MTDACATCRFWAEIFPEVGEKPTNKGDCNRYPPVLVVVAENDVKQLVPRTPATFWCGEYEGREPLLAVVTRETPRDYAAEARAVREGDGGFVDMVSPFLDEVSK